MFYMFLHVLTFFERFLHVFTCSYMFWAVFTCFGQKSGRPIFGVFVKHVVELCSLVKTEHGVFPQAMGQMLPVREH